MSKVREQHVHLGQFSSLTSICPGTEKKFTTIQSGICHPSSWHPSGKHLTVVVGGVWPYQTMAASGTIGGTDPAIMKMLAQKFNFAVSFYPIKDHKEFFGMVRNHKLV